MLYSLANGLLVGRSDTKKLLVARQIGYYGRTCLASRHQDSSDSIGLVMHSLPGRVMTAGASQLNASRQHDLDYITSIRGVATAAQPI